MTETTEKRKPRVNLDMVDQLLPQIDGLIAKNKVQSEMLRALRASVLNECALNLHHPKARAARRAELEASLAALVKLKVRIRDGVVLRGARGDPHLCDEAERVLRALSAITALDALDITGVT